MSTIKLRMGGFHTISIFLAVIGKRFGDGGLYDLIAEPNIAGSTTAERVLKEKHYNYGIRVIKYVYEAMHRVKIEAFEDWLSRENKFVYHRFLQSKEFDEMCSNPNAESFKAALEIFQGLFFLFEEFENILRDEEENTMSAYWMTFLDMTQVLLDYVKSIRVGNWELHVADSEPMLPWFHACDHQNYSRHFSYHWCRQKFIKDSHP